MSAAVTQRWRDRRDSYRPAGEVIRTAEYEVAAMADDATPKAFVERHHYAGTYPAARFRFGLYRGAELAGVAVFSVPANDKVITNILPGAALESTELGRLVLLDEVPGNGESWFVSRCFEVLRREHHLIGVVSFSDPMPRTTADGRAVMPGHWGCVYQALNATYTGRGTARTLRLLPDGTCFSDRAAQKIRKLEQGWKYSAALLEGFGAPSLDPTREDAATWLRTWRTAITRPLRHAGNHRYVWALDKRARRHLPPAQAFPKQIDVARPS
jgi:hypothetical protein